MFWEKLLSVVPKESVIDVLNIQPSMDGMPKEYTYLEQKYVEVPNVVGMNLEDAKQVLKSFNITYSGNGEKVIYQSPQAGMYIKEKGTVSIMLS